MSGDKITSSRLDKLVDLLAGLHGAQVKGLDDRTSIEQFWRLIWRWGKLFDILAPHTGCGLSEPYNRAVASVAFDKEDGFLVAHKSVVCADDVQPLLHGGLDPGLVFVGANSCRGDRGRDGWYKGIRVGRDQVVSILLEF